MKASQNNIQAINDYFNHLYFSYKQYKQIEPCNIDKIKFKYIPTKADEDYFLKQYIKWLEYLLQVNYNYGIYRLLLKISKEWRALHIDVERKQHIATEPFKVIIDTKDNSNVK